MMDNRAQISMEYLVIIAALITVGAMITLLALNFYSTRDALKASNKADVKRTLEMLR